jgi:hypothetical protein
VHPGAKSNPPDPAKLKEEEQLAYSRSKNRFFHCNSKHDYN